MDGIVYPRGVDSARVIQIIETIAARGSGSSEQPSRMVTQYWCGQPVLIVQGFMHWYTRFTSIVWYQWNPP